MDFFKFYSQLDSEPDDAMKLTPLTDDDMKTTAREDAIEWYMKNGKNTSKLGALMSDEEFQKYHELQ
jgi:hypothetical protein